MNRSPYLIFYDTRCGICQRGRGIIQRLRAAERVRFVDIHDRRAMARFPMLAPAAAHEQMHVLDPAGRLSGGYDAWARLAPVVSGVRGIERVMEWAPIRRIGRRIYRWVARNRHWLSACATGSCSVTSPRPLGND